MGNAIGPLLFQAPRTTLLNAERRERVWLETAHKVTIPAFFIDRGAAITVLFSHGNAEDLGMIYDWFKSFSAVLKINVMAYDYTGYGKSRDNTRGDVSITPSEDRVYNDVLAAYTYLSQKRNVRASQIVLYGRSLGSGPTCFLAQKLTEQGTPCAGVILQSPLLSAYRVAFNFRFTMPGDVFPNIDRIGRIESPIFIIHGTNDEVVPFWHGQELFLACQKRFRARPFWVTGAGHNNIESLLRDTTAFHDHIRYFLDSWCSRGIQFGSRGAKGKGKAHASGFRFHHGVAQWPHEWPMAISSARTEGYPEVFCINPQRCAQQMAHIDIETRQQATATEKEGSMEGMMEGSS